MGLSYVGAEDGIAQLVERRTAKPGVTLRWVRVPGAAKRFYFLPDSAVSADSLTGFVQALWGCVRSQTSKCLRALKSQSLVAVYRWFVWTDVLVYRPLSDAARTCECVAVAA